MPRRAALRYLNCNLLYLSAVPRAVVPKGQDQVGFEEDLGWGGRRGMTWEGRCKAQGARCKVFRWGEGGGIWNWGKALPRYSGYWGRLVPCQPEACRGVILGLLEDQGLKILVSEHASAAKFD